MTQLPSATRHLFHIPIPVLQTIRHIFWAFVRMQASISAARASLAISISQSWRVCASRSSTPTSSDQRIKGQLARSELPAVLLKRASFSRVSFEPVVTAADLLEDGAGWKAGIHCLSLRTTSFSEISSVPSGVAVIWLANEAGWNAELLRSRDVPHVAAVLWLVSSWDMQV